MLDGLAAAVLIALNLIGCATMGGLARRNRDGLSRLRPGMTRVEVVQVMGPGNRMADQPWSCVATHTETAAPVEIWYYLTKRPDKLDESSRDYLTPIVLQDDVVLGIGWVFLHDMGRHLRFIGSRNRSRIPQLTEGMTREQVVYLMTHEPARVGPREHLTYLIPQPQRTLTHPIPGNGEIEMLFYLVSQPTGDWAEDYLAPVVLKDGVLIGTGWKRARDIADEYDFLRDYIWATGSSDCK